MDLDRLTRKIEFDIFNYGESLVLLKTPRFVKELMKNDEYIKSFNRKIRSKIEYGSETKNQVITRKVKKDLKEIFYTNDLSFPSIKEFKMELYGRD